MDRPAKRQSIFSLKNYAKTPEGQHNINRLLIVSRKRFSSILGKAGV